MPNVKAVFTADISQFRASLAQATTAVSAFDRTTAQVNTSLKRFGNDFSGAKLQREAEEMAAAIKAVGGASVLTDANLKRANSTIKDAIQQYERLGKAAPDSIRSLSGEIDTLIAKGKQLDTAMPVQQTTRGFGLLQGAVAGVAAAITTQGLQAVKAFAADIVTTASDVADLSAKTGLTTTQVQQLGYAASQTGTSIDTITGAVTQLSKRLVEGGTGTVQAVRDLGLELGALRAMDPGTAFTTIADAIARVPDPMRQTQIAMALFGRSGAEILPAIKAGLSETAAEASRLGLVITEESIKALDDLGDAWDRAALRAKVAVADMAAGMVRAYRQVSQLPDLSLKVAVQAAGGGTPTGAAMFGGGPFGALLSSYFQMRMGKMDVVDLSTLGAAGRGEDIQLAPAKMPGMPFAPSKESLAATRKWQEELADLTGDKLQQEGRRLVQQLNEIAAAGRKVASANIEVVAKKLMDMRKAAFDAGEETIHLRQALDQLPIQARRIDSLNPLLIQQSINGAALNAITQAQRVTGSRAGFTGDITSTNPTAGMLIGLPQSATVSPYTLGVIASSHQRIAKATKDWRTELRGVAQAFSQLAQIAGPSLDGVSRSIGTVVASADAAASMVSALGRAFPGLGLTDAQGRPTGRGRMAGGVLASASTGAALGSMTNNMLVGGALGAGGGLATGAMLGLTGASLGLTAGVGAGAAIYMAWRNRQAEKKALSEQRAQVISAAGGYEEFRTAVEGAGFEFDYFLSKFNSNDVDVFTEVMNTLNVAMAEQRTESSKLAKSLSDVARVQGLLSQQQIAQLRNLRPGDEATDAVNAFLEGQAAQSEAGILAAVDALARYKGNVLKDFNGSVQAAAAGLAALFGEALARGESAVSVIGRLGGAMDTVATFFTKNGGKMPTGFGTIQDLSSIVNGEQTGIAVQTASGLGSALAGFANTGVFAAMPELFGDIANGIGAAWKALENFGAGGQRGAALFQPYLQTLWELIDANPELEGQLDDQTKALLDFATANGIVGPSFRDAASKMQTALERLIDKLDIFIDRMSTAAGLTFPAPSAPPSPVDPANPNPAPDQTSPANGGDYTTPLAIGGIVTRPTRALIGEAGPEAVIPLNRLRMHGGRMVTIVTPVMVDGREIARVTNRYAPDERRLMGAA